MILIPVSGIAISLRLFHQDRFWREPYIREERMQHSKALNDFALRILLKERIERHDFVLSVYLDRERIGVLRSHVLENIVP